MSDADPSLVNPGEGRRPRCVRGRGCLVGKSRHLVQVTACGCRAWSCDACAPARRADVKAQIEAGEPTSLLTLTWHAKRPEAPEEARLAMARAFHRLTWRVRRKYPGHAFEFFVVPEITRAGYPHLHVALRAAFIPQGWLSDQWASLVGAPVVDIRALRSPRWGAGYLAKYLTKARDRLGTAKRYWKSRGWLEEGWAAGRRRRSAWVWGWHAQRPEEAAAALNAEGFMLQAAGPGRWAGWALDEYFPRSDGKPHGDPPPRAIPPMDRRTAAYFNERSW